MKNILPQARNKQNDLWWENQRKRLLIEKGKLLIERKEIYNYFEVGNTCIVESEAEIWELTILKWTEIDILETKKSDWKKLSIIRFKCNWKELEMPSIFFLKNFFPLISKRIWEIRNTIETINSIIPSDKTQIQVDKTLLVICWLLS